MKSVLEERGRLYDGLYDGPGVRRVRTSSRIQLLNPSFNGDDESSRRFALLEVD